MTVWRILSFLILLTPVLTLILGLICWRYPPKKGPVGVGGYRSRRAQASQGRPGSLPRMWQARFGFAWG